MTKRPSMNTGTPERKTQGPLGRILYEGRNPRMIKAWKLAARSSRHHMLSFPRTELSPIPEAPEPDGESPQQHYGLDPISAPSPAASVTRDAGASRAPEWRRVRDWPAQPWPLRQEARGKLTITCFPDGGQAARTEFSVQDGVLSLTAATQNSQDKGSSKAVLQVPVRELAVGLRRARTSMLILAKLCENKVHDEIYCFADNQGERNKWTAAFRRMGVPIFDVQ